jgi:hypothetical protein
VANSHPVEHSAADAAGDHQPAQPQPAQVLRHRRPGRRDLCREGGDVWLALSTNPSIRSHVKSARCPSTCAARPPHRRTYRREGSGS